MRTPRLRISLVVAAAAALTVVAAEVSHAAAERHPEIQRAITALQRARTALQNASHDFGGHRAAALSATDEALKQLRLAQQYDK